MPGGSLTQHTKVMFENMFENMFEIAELKILFNVCFLPIFSFKRRKFKLWFANTILMS